MVSHLFGQQTISAHLLGTVWATLLAGASKVANEPELISAKYVAHQALICFICGYIFCGAGMVWNDWIDLNIDKNVARTKKRPLAAGTITTSEALIWMMAQYAMSWGIMSWMLENQNV